MSATGTCWSGGPSAGAADLVDYANAKNLRSIDGLPAPEGVV